MLNTSYSIILAALVCMVTDTFAAPIKPSSEAQSVQQEQLIRDQQQQQVLEQKMQPSVNVHIEGGASQPILQEIPQNEFPSFEIKDITLVGDDANQFQFALLEAIKQSGFKPSMCLGAQGVNYMMTLVQNIVIAKGYITTRIFAAPQDLNNGHLILTVFPGRVHEIRYNTNNPDANHVDRVRIFSNKFPTSKGDILNLRELEQGLENLKRIPTAEADIQIVPSDNPNESDVIVTWSQSRPVRFSMGLDNSGSLSTGKYQGNATLSLDNIMGLSDLFYVSLNQNLGNQNKIKDTGGSNLKNSTNSYAFHYSIPFGNWLWNFNHNFYKYHQAVSGINANYDYNGDSVNTNLGITRLLYRDAHQKTHLTIKAWQRESHNYINDTEIDIQHRRMAGWAAELDHKTYIGNSTINLKLGYKRGTGANHSLTAPEETFGLGTSRMQLVTIDTNVNIPFTVAKQTFSYESSLHTQWNYTPLVSQDQLAIGGRYTVRGFDGEMSLMGVRGGYWRNDLNWQYLPGQLMYVGADVGHVVSDLTGSQVLAGAVLGFKGQMMLGGMFYYDLFVGAPIYKPLYFKTSRTTAGFNLNYSF